MNNIVKAWTAGFVRRWHTNTHLCDTVDYDSGHQQRCCILLLLLWPNASRTSIIDTLTHDQGEIDAGDMAHPAKRKHPQIAELLQLVEDASIKEQGFSLGHITDQEYAQRKFVDFLDSYLWMLRHKPYLRRQKAWSDQKEQLLEQAQTLDVFDKVQGLIDDMTEFYT